MRFPESKIGELVKTAHDWVHRAENVTAALETKPGPKSPPAETIAPPVLPKMSLPPHKKARK